MTSEVYGGEKREMPKRVVDPATIICTTTNYCLSADGTKQKNTSKEMLEEGKVRSTFYEYQLPSNGLSKTQRYQSRNRRGWRKKEESVVTVIVRVWLERDMAIRI